MTVHPNSTAAYHEDRPAHSKRARQILAHVWFVGPQTDRQIMQALGYPEPNCIRPRVTELIGDGLLRESGVVTCEVTGKAVRLVEAVRKQGELF